MANLPPITRDDVDDAINHVRSFGIPKKRGSTKFCLVAGSDHLPPKYIVALAARPSLGRELEPSEFSGGPQTNQLLKELGFKVRACNCGGEIASGVMRPPRPTPKKSTAKRLNTPSRASGPTEAPSLLKGKGVLSNLKRAASSLLVGKPQDGRAGKQSASVNTAIVRVVTSGPPPLAANAAEQALLRAFQQWPRGVRARFAITPGGFVEEQWPSDLQIPVSWQSRRQDLGRVTAIAERCLKRVVTDRVWKAARGHVDVLTVGIDVWAGPNNAIAELVAVYNVQARQLVRWTGKSYPTPAQVNNLFQVTDLDSHFLELAGERVLVLGCHDLAMYDPRGQANASKGGEKKRRSRDFHQRAARFCPTVVLQHPHSTDSVKTWRNSWKRLRDELPSVRSWGAGIAHYREGAGRPVRDRLEDVLAATASGDVQDIVLKPSGLRR